MRESSVEITEAEAAALARWAGLTMLPERLPQLAINLKAARVAVSELARVAPDPAAPVDAPFDPSWGEDKEGAL